MTEFFTGLFTGYILTWPTLLVLVLFAVWAETNEVHTLAVIFGMLLSFLAVRYFHVSLAYFGYYAAVYFILGVLWSFARYRRFVRKKVEKWGDMKSLSTEQRARRLEELSPKALAWDISTWILIWPISLIDNFVGTFLDFLRLLVTKWLRGIYQRILDGVVREFT